MRGGGKGSYHKKEREVLLKRLGPCRRRKEERRGGRRGRL